jgi:alpha-methylacyl-CoA racemase
VAGPLTGLKVIEMAGLAPGPFCAMLLADMGAEVLRICRAPAAADKGDPHHQLLNRNRRTIVIDLKSDRGITITKRLIDQADVLIEGFRPGVMERLGLGPDTCLSANPRLIYGRITGWGQIGPLANTAGHDLNYIALTGALHSLGRRGEAPAIPLNMLGDFGGGGLFLAFGVLSALFERSRSGLGQVVDAAMVDGVSALMTYVFGKRAANQWSDVRGENLLDGASPWYRVYETRDRLFVTIAAVEDKFYDKLLKLLNLDKTELPPRSERDSWPILHTRFSHIFRSKTRREWCELFDGHDVCFAPVLSIPEAVNHPHNISRGAFVKVDGVLQPAPAPRFSRTPAGALVLPDSPGTLTSSPLLEWGFTEDELAQDNSNGASELPIERTRAHAKARS